MATCVVCKKRGLFLKLNHNNICAQCEKAQNLENAKHKEQEELRQRRNKYLQEKLHLAQEELANIPSFLISLSHEKRSRRKGYESPSFSNITPKGIYKDFVVFDTETTGLSPSKDRILELAAIRFIDGVPVELFHTLINPEREIPTEVSSINGITAEMISESPTISQILPAFEAFVGKSALVAHNLEFDLKFLYYSGSFLTDSPRKYFDTLEQAKKLLKRPKAKYDKEYGTYDIDYESDYDVLDYKLGTLCDYYNITIPKAHRANADAFATGKLFLNLIIEKQGYR